MKASNKFVCLALLLTLLSLLVYDLLLRAEFRSGRYKDPYRNYAALAFKDFDVLDLNSATVANVKVVQGPFHVRVDKYALDYVKVKQEGKRLQIDVVFDGNYRGNQNPYILIVSCPKLVELNTGASYRANDQWVTDTIYRADWNMRRVMMDGFTQDSLHISQDYGSSVVLANDHIRSLRAVVGESAGSGSNLVIQRDNRFQEAVLDIEHNSKLELDNAMIDVLKYRLGDSAKLVISGKAQNLLTNSKPYQK
jgi:hypothetical protein